MIGRAQRALARALFASAILTAPLAAQDPKPGPASRPAEQGSKLPPLGAPAGAFGAPVTLTEATPLERVLAEPRAFEGKQVRVDATIADVCRKKGCWMVLGEGERTVRVKFKDYAFFVPRDASGRRVIVQGEVKAEEISEEVARHYAEEGGEPERAAEIHGPQQVVSLVATGVEVLARDEVPLLAQGAAEVLTALEQRIAQGAKLSAAAGKVASLEEAFRALRAAPGGRTAEVGLAAETKDFYAFSQAGEGEPFTRGWAVRRTTGEVVRFGAR